MGKAVKPPCVECGDASRVRLLGGGTHRRYRYRCLACDVVWQQIPPHLRAAMTDEVSGDDVKRASRQLATYRCSVCRMVKKGHVCPGFAL